MRYATSLEYDTTIVVPREYDTTIIISVSLNKQTLPGSTLSPICHWHSSITLGVGTSADWHLSITLGVGTSADCIRIGFVLRKGISADYHSFSHLFHWHSSITLGVGTSADWHSSNNTGRWHKRCLTTQYESDSYFRQTLIPKSEGKC